METEYIESSWFSFIPSGNEIVGSLPLGLKTIDWLNSRRSFSDDFLGLNETVSSTQVEKGLLSCGDNEGWGLLSSKYGDFTPCTVHGIFPSIFGIAIILLGLYLIKTLRGKKNVGNRVTWVFYLKLVLAALQVAFQIALFSVNNSKGIISLGLGVNTVASFIIFGLQYIEQFKCSISNAILITYWFLLTVIGAAKILNLCLRGNAKSPFFILTVFSLVTCFLVLVIELNFPMRPLHPLKKRKTSPLDEANIFSRITFIWMSGLMRRGYLKYLVESDLPPLPEKMRSQNTLEQVSRFWEAQPRKSLVKALVMAVGGQFMLGGLFKAFQDVLSNIQPRLLRILIEFVNDYTESKKVGVLLPLTRGIFIAFGMFTLSVVQTACLHQYFQRAFDTGLKIKSALTGMVYNKALILSNETKLESNTGDIVNLMSVDVQRLQDLMQNLQIVWSGPFQIVMCLYSLYGLLGNAMWAGVVIMIVMVPVNAQAARYQKNLQKVQMKNKDERSRLINEILNNIKSLKLYAWEHPYLEKLDAVRNGKELKTLKKIGVTSAIITFCWNLAPTFVSCSTFAIYVLVLKKPLTTEVVFPSLALFNLLSFPLAVFPMVISSIIEAQVSVSRLYNFLTSEELQADAVIRDDRQPKNGDICVYVRGGTFLWEKIKKNQNLKIALLKINLEVKKGELDCIVGRVGSGKSSILQAILGDLYKLEGEVRLRGKVAYVPQAAWIMNGTVKENILFGHKYEPKFYQTVLSACALTTDLSVLPDGDATEVGEKGISLSGGQKARLSLARAVYSRADVYLMDDPLSAVDEHVRKHLITNVMGSKGILKTKCRILATNCIGVLSIADNLHLVTEGRLAEQGTLDDIMKQESSQLRKLINEFGSANEDTDNETKKEESPEEKTFEDKMDFDDVGSAEIVDAISLRRASEVTLRRDEEEGTEESEDDNSKSRTEHVQRGKVDWSVYWAYAYACNLSSAIIFILTCIFGMLDNILANFWLKHWSEVNTRFGGNPHVWKYLGIYFILGVGYSIIIFAQNIVMWLFCTINASRTMHESMALSVLRAPMSFFETTPIGRITNRFSNDIYKLDEIVGRVFAMFISNAVKVTFTIGVICFSTWTIIFLYIPLLFLYGYYHRYYLRTSRELKRLELVSRSPIYANFQESLNGVSVIRAFGQEERFSVMNEKRVDKNVGAMHPSISANRWLAVRLEFLGSVIILGASALSILALPSGRITAGLIGLSVSYALQITQSLNWVVRMSVDVENNIVSVERILEYSNLKSEAPEILPDSRPPTDWPSKGEIKFNNYSTRYRPELDLVLKNIDLSIKAKEKIGIVGRTGAGKSSITLALFRIIEKVDGNVVIDDIDTSSIGLTDLRLKLSIIPQDSQVFEGTIRSNLDPFNIYKDEEIWRVLELSKLKEHVNKMHSINKGDDQGEASALDVRVSEGGSNLSSGQKQLMCLARVLLKLNTSNVLVLDEATAAVDVETDLILQKTIRSEFKDMTIITIAHRLNTIIDSDKIMVLEAGEVKEFDSPQNLLKNKDSLFYSLSKQGGLVEE